MVGICRGAQLLNVMNGGKLHQHVTGHGTSHRMRTLTDDEFRVTSTHHQMMIPAEDHQLLGYAIDIAFAGSQPEPEVVWYPRTKSMCVQFHPERLEETSAGYQYFQKLLKDFIL